MNSRYRPLFILFSVLFLAAGAYFFIALKNDTIMDDISIPKMAAHIPDKPVKLSTIDEGEGLATGDSVRSYELEEANCHFHWKVHIHAKFRTPNLSLIYSPIENQNCELLNQKMSLIHQSVLKRIFRDFDRKRFFELTFPRAQLEELLDLFAPFRMNVQVKSGNQQMDTYKFNPK